MPLYLFTGENEYELHQLKTRWVQGFVEKYGEDGIDTLDGKGLSVGALLDEVSMMPFLSPKRLVMVRGVPKFAPDDIDSIVANMHPDVFLVFIDPKPDKRLKGTGHLLKTAEKKECAPLKGAVLERWMQEEVASNGKRIESRAIALLIESLGTDQFLLASELQKLCLIPREQITAQDVEVHMLPSEEGVAWKLSDILLSGKKAAALAFVHRMLSRGGEPYLVWNVLLHMAKNLTAVRAAMQEHGSDQSTVAKEAGVHPFALRSLLPAAKKLSHQQLSDFVHWMTDADIKLKTGDVRATDEKPQELRTLIDLSILRCP